MSFIDFEPKPQPQQQPSFSSWLQEYWKQPHPHGLVAMLKATLNSIPDAVNGSIAATGAPPSTEEEAYRYNLARERGVIGAFRAASTLGPSVPQSVGAASGRYAVGRSIPQTVERRLPGHPTEGNGSAPGISALPAPDRIGRTPSGWPSSNGSVPAFPPPASGAAPSGGLLRRLQELEAIERRAPASNMGSISPEKDPNFRQLSRFPILPTVESAGSIAPHLLDIPDFLRAPNLRTPNAVDTERSDEPSSTSSNAGGKGPSRRGGGDRGGGGGGGGGGSGRGRRRNYKDVCDERLEEELRRCQSYKDDVAHPHYFSGCKERAEGRWGLCYKHRGPDHPGPGEWRPGTDQWPGDEETWRNYDR
jgi:uncharacterized membrane protein YgcG